jgi:hypothetical protein
MTITRKYTANIHNVRFHSGQTSVVRLLAYLMGTTTGKYPTPDASVHPRYRSKSSHQEEYPSNRYFHDYSTANISSSREHFFGFNAISNSVDKANTRQQYRGQLIPHRGSPVNSTQKQSSGVRDDPFAYLDIYQEAADMLLAVKSIMSKYNSLQSIQPILNSCWQNYVVTGDLAIINEILATAQRISKWIDTANRLKSGL